MIRPRKAVGLLGLIVVVVALTATRCGDGKALSVTGVDLVASAPRAEGSATSGPGMPRDTARFEVPAGQSGTLRLTLESVGNYDGAACTLYLGGVFPMTLTQLRAPVPNNTGGGVPGVFTGDVAVPALASGQSASGELVCQEKDLEPGSGKATFDIVTTGEASPTPSPEPSASADDTPMTTLNITVTADQFSLGMAPEVTGSPGVPAGYIRLWDMATAWKDVNPRAGVFDWTVLDQRVAQVEAAGAKVLYVAGLTPAWAASGGGCDARWGDASCTAPADPATFAAYLTAVMQRYGGRITAVEVWNEANLQTFWKGSAEQMADLTKRGYDAIKAVSPNTAVLAASSTTRLARSVKTFFAPYATALKGLGYPIDGWTIHTYPAATASPVGRYDGIENWKAELAGATGDDPAALRKPVWDTEINYGLAGPGAIPDNDYGAPTDGAYVARTFVDSMRARIGSTFWYMWTATAYSLVGVQMYTGTSSTINAYNTVRSWTSGATLKGCQEKTGGIVRCFFTKPGSDPFFIAMSKSDTPVSYSAAAALSAVTWEGAVLSPAGTVSLGIGPVKFTCTAGASKALCPSS